MKYDLNATNECLLKYMKITIHTHVQILTSLIISGDVLFTNTD